MKKTEFQNWEFTFDKKETQSYYKFYKDKCTCTSCRNFRMNAREHMPAELREFLEGFGIDILAPIEQMSACCDYENNTAEQELVYAVKGYAFSTVEEPVRFGDIEIYINQLFPNNEMDKPYFTLWVTGMYFPWIVDDNLLASYPVYNNRYQQKSSELFNFVYADKNSPIGFRITKPFRIIGNILSNLLSIIPLAIALLILETFAFEDLFIKDEYMMFTVVPSVCLFVALNLVSIRMRECAVLDDNALVVYHKSVDIANHWFVTRMPYDKIIDFYNAAEMEHFNGGYDIMGGAYDKYCVFIRTKHKTVVLPVEKADEFIALLSDKIKAAKSNNNI